jgi:WD40 repeat protein
VSTGETYCQLKEHADSVVSLAFSADGQYIATGGMDGKVIVSTALDGQLVCELDGPSEITVRPTNSNILGFDLASSWPCSCCRIC